MERVLGNKVNVSKSGNLSLSVSWRAVNLAFSRILGFADKRFPLYPPLPFPLPFFWCSRSKISRNKVIQATFASPKRYFTEINCWVPLLTAKRPLYVTQLTPLVPSDVVCTFTCLFCVCPPGCHLSLVSPAVIDQKYGKLFTFMVKAWNFARLQPTLRLTFLDMEPSQIQHWTRVLRRP